MAADDRGKGASSQRVACQADAGSAEDKARSREPGHGCVRRSHQTDAAGPEGGPDAEAGSPLNLTERFSTSSSNCSSSASPRGVLGGDILLTQVQGAESRGRSEHRGRG